MKNSLFLLGAAAVVALSSCSKNEVLEVAENRAIGFDSFVGKPTKGVINSVNDLSSFNVFGGYSSLTNNFNNVVVTKSAENVWGYDASLTQYWEASKTYTFQAYAGAQATPLNSEFKVEPTDKGVQFTGFTATGDADLLASDVVTVTTNESSVPNSNAEYKVPFTFRHVLSMIKFTFESELATNVNITISDLTIKQINSTGNYTLSTQNTGTWGTLDNPTNYKFTTDGAFAAPDTKVSSEVIVLPQTYEAKAIEVTFTLNATGGLTITNAKHTVMMPAIAWEEGMRYNYVATLTKDNIDPENPLKPIEFAAPKVTPWEDQNGGDVEFNKQ